MRWLIVSISFFMGPYLFSLRAQADTTIRVGVPASQTSAVPLHIGAQRDIFPKYGLRVEPIVIANGRTNTSALISGNTQFIIGSSPELFFVGEQGGDIVGIGCWDNSSPYSLISREKIRSVKELKGKRLAVGGVMDKSHLFLKLLLTEEGLDPEKDVEIVFVGGSSARLGLLGAGKIDAAPAAPEFGKRAEKLGLYSVPVAMQYPKGLITTRKSLLAANRDIVRSFLRGYMDSVRYLIQNKEGSVQVMARVFKLQDRPVLEYAYDVLKNGAVVDLTPTEEGIKNVLRTMA
ncbi:MAG TPA: ABC transporter substrate-binding protein, partial [Candidatus Acidoferrales bacterium]|nr:ABC transporter substrate-binding protein [Candidatus Acidoferrales bacterium]